MAPPEPLNKRRLRPWQHRARRALEHAPEHLAHAAAVEGASLAVERAGLALENVAQQAARQQQARQLDVMQKMLQRRHPHFYAARARDVGRPLATATRIGSRLANPALRKAAAVGGGALAEIGGFFGKKLLGKVPVLGTAYEVLRPSPLGISTVGGVGREMLRRWRTGQDPWIREAQPYLRTPNDWRRANTFMMLGINPLRGGFDRQGRQYRFAGDVGPNTPLNPKHHWVFEPEHIGLSSRNTLRERPFR